MQKWCGTKRINPYVVGSGLLRKFVAFSIDEGCKLQLKKVLPCIRWNWKGFVYYELLANGAP